MDDTAPSAEAIEAEAQNLFVQEQYEQAAERFALAQSAYAQIGDPLKAAEMLNNLGVAYQQAGRYEQAEAALRDAQHRLAELGDQHREAQALGSLGVLYAGRKRYEEAEDCFNRAIDLFEQLDERALQAETLRVLAVMQFKRGKFSKALATYEDAQYFLPRSGCLYQVLRVLLKLRGVVLRLSPLR